MNPLYDRVAVLVVSCDNYADLWEPFFFLFRKFWSDCPYKVYLLTNHLEPTIEGVTTIAVGEDLSWSDNVIAALAHIPHDYIFLMLEDLMILGKINSTDVDRIFHWAVQAEANYVRLNPTVKADRPHNALVGVVSKGSFYRSSVVMPLYKKTLLSTLLRSGENAWEFEYYGSERSDRFDGFYATHSDFIPNVNAVVKRVWEYDAAQRVQKCGAVIDFSQRRIMTVSERLIWKMKRLRTFFFQVVPPAWRRTVKAWFAGKKPAV